MRDRVLTQAVPSHGSLQVVNAQLIALICTG